MKQDRIIELSKLLEDSKRVKKELKVWSSGSVRFAYKESPCNLVFLKEIETDSEDYRSIREFAIRTLQAKLSLIDIKLEEA